MFAPSRYHFRVNSRYNPVLLSLGHGIAVNWLSPTQLILRALQLPILVVLTVRPSSAHAEICINLLKAYWALDAASFLHFLSYLPNPPCVYRLIGSIP